MRSMFLDNYTLNWQSALATTMRVQPLMYSHAVPSILHVATRLVVAPAKLLVTRQEFERSSLNWDGSYQSSYQIASRKIFSFHNFVPIPYGRVVFSENARDTKNECRLCSSVLENNVQRVGLEY